MIGPFRSCQSDGTVVSLETLVFTKLHLVPDFCVFKPATWLCSICNHAEYSLLWWRFSIKSKDYSTNYGFLKRIISADDMVSDAFRWHTKQNEGVTGTYSANFYIIIIIIIIIIFILLVDPACAIRLSRRKVLQRLEIYKHDSAQQWLKKGSVIWRF